MNWGPGAQGGFQNALALGMQVGDMARQRKEHNALSAYAKDPSEANFGAVADVRPDIAIPMQQQQQQQQAASEAEARLADLRARALAGDDAALTQLATESFDQWKGINSEVKAKAAADSEVLGNAAIQLINTPYEQRPGQIVAYAQQFPQFAEKIQEIAYLPQAQQDEALRAVVAQAKMVGKLIEIERPSYQVLPQGADLVNTRDPRAVAQFAPGGGQVQAPALSDIDAELRRRGVIR
jgi:hypothetical protein